MGVYENVSIQIVGLLGNCLCLFLLWKWLIHLCLDQSAKYWKKAPLSDLKPERSK